MAVLPPERLKSQLRPFTHCGVDCFGPFSVTLGRARARVKRYVCSFTYLSTRGVTLEVLGNIDAEFFLLGFTRIICRRVLPASMHSDNGTNFVACKKDLEWYAVFKHGLVTREMKGHHVEWHFNPPASPHFGRVWERLVLSCKRTLMVARGKREVNEEVFRTIIPDVEALLNSQPLTGC